MYCGLLKKSRAVNMKFSEEMRGGAGGTSRFVVTIISQL